MTLLIALALSIGGLAVVATWLYLGPLAALNMQIWRPSSPGPVFITAAARPKG